MSTPDDLTQPQPGDPDRLRLPHPGRAFARLVWWACQRIGNPFPAGRRGVAIVLAMVSITILSVTVVEFAYQTNVNSAMAANNRDSLHAYYLAKSGMNLGTLLLNFQFELEQDPLIGRFMKRSNFQVYPLVNLFLTPFTSGRLESQVGGVDLADTGATGFGGFAGSFDVHIEPEEGKINLNGFADDRLAQATVTQLCLMFQGEQHDDIFETEIGNRRAEKVDRTQLVANIVDWVDLNNTTTLLNDFCVPEGSGSGDEGSPYTKYDVDYEVKSGKMDTIEELRLVAGMNDAAFNRFADSFTVYPVDKVNLNLANFFVIQSLLCSHVAGAGLDNWPCRDQNVAFQVLYLSLALDGVRQFFSNPLNLLFYYMDSGNAPVPLPGAKKGQTVAYLNTRQLTQYINAFKQDPLLLQQFIAYSPTARMTLGPNIGQAGGLVAPEILIDFDQRPLLRRVTTRSPQIYRVVATGTYGDTSKTLVAVVDFSKKGRFLYWKEY